MILNDFDEDKRAVVNPSHYINKLDDFPQIVVSCFARTTFERMKDMHKHERILSLSIANMEIPVYKIDYYGIPVALMNAYVGAAGCVALFEDLIAYGMEKLVIFGTCGVLDASIEDASIIIPDAAIRDEGTSYHYAKTGDEIEVNSKYIPLVTRLLDERKIAYTKGKTWTTDAIYRETKSKMERRKQQGCICVDMECSALAALAEFREIDIFHFFYAADNLDNEIWDARSLSNHHKLEEKDKIALLALTIAEAMVKSTS